MSHKNLGWRDILELAEREYLDQTIEGFVRWPPKCHNRDSKAAPANFGANLSQAPVYNRGSGVTCYNCGKTGHKKNACPLLKSTKSNSNGSKGRNHNGKGKTSNQSSPDPKFVPPGANATPMRVINGGVKIFEKHIKGRKFEWCAACKRWSTTHNTSIHRGTGNQASQSRNGNGSTNPDANVNFGLVPDPSFWMARCVPIWRPLVDPLVVPAVVPGQDSGQDPLVVPAVVPGQGYWRNDGCWNAVSGGQEGSPGQVTVQGTPSGQGLGFPGGKRFGQDPAIHVDTTAPKTFWQWEWMVFFGLFLGQFLYSASMHQDTILTMLHNWFTFFGTYHIWFRSLTVGHLLDAGVLIVTPISWVAILMLSPSLRNPTLDPRFHPIDPFVPDSRDVRRRKERHRRRNLNRIPRIKNMHILAI
mmetsp:Transcript_6141/g.12451  ORF Transcript_6141/g.12451 Transcript_6141/m.12451 type:complete len:415 (+) Transcript_6141:878-2122(+)